MAGLAAREVVASHVILETVLRNIRRYWVAFAVVQIWLTF